MKIVFLADYLNHHQLPTCLVLKNTENVDFTYIATMPTRQERLKLGYEDMNYSYPFVVRAFENAEEMEKAKALCLCADILIWGSAPFELAKERLESGKLTFRISERIYKSGKEMLKIPYHMLNNLRNRKIMKNTYLLTASAFAARDYALTGAFRNRAYKWGYFPMVRKYADKDKLFSEKKENSILWVARFIEWKHPLSAVIAVKRLKEEGCPVQLEMIGTGPLEEGIREYVKANHLDDTVFLSGSMSTDKVRDRMEKSAIFVLTSDQNEGWGAVVNEAMSSGCAVVVGDQPGSAAFLIKNGENGVIFRNGNEDELYSSLKSLVIDSEKQERMGRKAIESISTVWNAENAVSRLLVLAEAIQKSGKPVFPFEDGVCSKAEVLNKNWFRKQK